MASPFLALRSISFLVLGVDVGFEAIRDLITSDKPDSSIVGIVLNAVALLVMVPVAIAQRRTGQALDNEVLVAQSAETWLSNYLSVSLLVGLGLNAAFGLWWADPLRRSSSPGIAFNEGPTPARFVAEGGLTMARVARRIPRETRLDSTLALLRDGYEFRRAAGASAATSSRHD